MSKNKLVRHKHRGGFTIAETLIVSVLVGILAIIVMESGAYFARSKALTAQDEAFLRLVQSTDLVLTNQSLCNLNFAAMPAPLPSANLTQIVLASPVTLPQDTLFRVFTGPNDLFLNSLRVTSISMFLVGFDLTSIATLEVLGTYNLLVEAERHMPGMTGDGQKLARSFNFLVKVDLSALPAITIKNCELPGGTASAVVDLPTSCADAGGTWFPGGPGDRCNYKASICKSMGAEYDTTHDSCNPLDIRQALLTGMIGDGPCPVGQYLKTVGPDGKPLCGGIGALQSSPVDVGVLSTATCGRCFKSMATTCKNTAPIPPRVPRYAVFEGGVMRSTGCGDPVTSLPPPSMSLLPECQTRFPPDPLASVPCP